MIAGRQLSETAPLPGRRMSYTMEGGKGKRLARRSVSVGALPPVTATAPGASTVPNAYNLLDPIETEMHMYEVARARRKTNTAAFERWAADKKREDDRKAAANGRRNSLKSQSMAQVSGGAAVPSGPGFGDPNRFKSRSMAMFGGVAATLNAVAKFKAGGKRQAARSHEQWLKEKRDTERMTSMKEMEKLEAHLDEADQADLEKKEKQVRRVVQQFVKKQDDRHRLKVTLLQESEQFDFVPQGPVRDGELYYGDGNIKPNEEEQWKLGLDVLRLKVHGIMSMRLHSLCICAFVRARAPKCVYVPRHFRSRCTSLLCCADR